MRYLLSVDEQFKDHVELVGVACTAAATLFIFVYFGMLFFSETVRLAAPEQKLGLLAFYGVVAGVSLFVPFHRNWARWVLGWLVLGQGVYSASRWLDHGHWAHVVTVAFAVYAYWVLQHPAAIAQFRDLRPAETRQRNDAKLFQAWLAGLALYAAFQAWSGLQLAIAQEHELTGDSLPALSQMLWAAWLAVLIASLRRLQRWSRWLGAVTFCVAGVVYLPDTFVVRGYWFYWLALLKCIFFFSLAGYLLFARTAREHFVPLHRPGAERSS
jgi:hypothetical protein